jgi:hypothetical protein
MHFDPSRSLAELGLVPRPIRQSLAETIAWLGLTAPDRGVTTPRSARPSVGRIAFPPLECHSWGR